MSTQSVCLNEDRLREAVALAGKAARELCEIPEDSFDEFRTTAYLRECVRRFPVSVFDEGLPTGFIAYLDRGAERSVALRADIDAVSTEAGPKHLCGHNHHAASLLAAAAYLCGEDDLPVNVVFLFQPAEEMTAGARLLLESRAYRSLPVEPDAVFGIHNRPELTVGEIAVKRGALMAAKTEFEVIFKGKSGHASAPHHCVDPILPGAAFVQAVQSVVARCADPLDTGVCGVYTIHSGDDSINPPEICDLKGTCRALKPDTHKKMLERLETLTRELARAYECSGSFRHLMDVPALINSDSLYEQAKSAAAAVCGMEHVVDTEPALASEDFAFYGEAMPSFFYWVGSSDAALPSDKRPAWHDSCFRVADGYQSVAVPLLIRSVLGAEQ